ncbi:MAG: M48 family metalloprotease [Proteobacteria bacterium]|nr:M48 family metalloprotease [Pseudomonadota bacterium]
MKALARYGRYALAAGLIFTSGAVLAQDVPSLLKGLLGGGGSTSGSSGGSNLDRAASIAGNVGKALKEPSEQEEIAIGQQFASSLLGAKPLWNNPGAQRYVNTLGRWIASQTERPDLPWTFGVLDDTGYNAFATPGGYIFVTKGLLQRMGSEAELAGVLGHEIGHVLKKHHLNAVRKGAGLAILGEVVSAKAGGNPQVNEFVKNGILNVFGSGLSKSDEYEADRIGVVLAARAGYDPFGLPSALQMLEGQSGNDASFSLMFATHPTPASRLEELDKLMDAKFDALPHVQGKLVKDRLREFR